MNLWEREYTDGLINFIDFIQDEAATVLGEEVVFGRTPPDWNKSNDTNNHPLQKSSD